EGLRSDVEPREGVLDGPWAFRDCGHGVPPSVGVGARAPSASPGSYVQREARYGADGAGPTRSRTNSRSPPFQRTSTDCARRPRSETTGRLSPQTVATSCVMPAARASAASSRASSEPIPRPWSVSATSNAISPVPPMRTRRAMPAGAGSPGTYATSTWWVSSTRASSARSSSESRGFAPQNRRCREAEPSRANTAAIVSVSPLGSGRIVSPRTWRACIRPWCRCGPGLRVARAGHLLDMARYGHPDYGSVEQEIRFCELDGRRIAYATVGECPTLLFGGRWVTHLEEEWEDPHARAFFEELARTHQVVRYDRLGAGLSDREAVGTPTVESEMRALA